jgi:hypothetical protein
LAVLAAATAIALSWRRQLPDPVASHWGLNGRADGFSSLTSTLTIMLTLGIVLVAGFGAATFRLGQSAITRRIGASTTVWSALFVSLLTLGTLYIQRGLADARDAGGIGAVFLVTIVGSLVPAVAVGLLIASDPPMSTDDPVAADAPRARLVAGRETGWTATVSAGPALSAGLLAVALLLAMVVVTRFWVLLIVVGIIGLAVASMFRWVVRVDDSGLLLRSALGWPRIRVPLDEVVRADVTEVRPVRDFGGWGLRVGRGGRVGVVLRGGEALLVQRTGGRSVAVTVDNANIPAGLLNTLADRARTTNE